jgi:hypothetical protein
MNLNDTAVSYIRTYTPALVGLVLGWLVTWKIPVPAGTKEAITPVLSGAFIAAYYAGVRYAEKRWPATGWLLGVPKQPVYQAQYKPDSQQGTGTQPVPAVMTSAAAQHTWTPDCDGFHDPGPCPSAGGQESAGVP